MIIFLPKVTVRRGDQNSHPHKFKRGGSAAFTLLELLVALALLAVISSLGYLGFSSLLYSKDVVQQASHRVANLQKTFWLLEEDLGQVVPRSVRQGVQHLPPFLGAGGGSSTLFEMTKADFSRDVSRSNMRRINYRVENGALIRGEWLHLDRPHGSPAYEQKLLTGLLEWELSYLDDARKWQHQWPPVQTTQNGTATSLLPRAVSLKLTFEELGTIERLFPLTHQMP